MKILAIDFGKKRMGFAIGNPLIMTATPIQQLTRKNLKIDIVYIKTLIEEYDISKIILGLPLNMDGTKGKIVEEVEAFSSHLFKKTGINVELVDERLSSFEAEEMLKPSKPDYKKRKQVLDSISALVLLRSYMEKK
jgi:putative Holliday junction resolvase